MSVLIVIDSLDLFHIKSSNKKNIVNIAVYLLNNK